MTHHNEISPVITAGVWESDQMAFSTSSIRQWRGDKDNLKAWSPMKMNRPKPGVLGSQDWFAKGQRETRGQAEGSGGQGVEREARRQPQMSSGGKNVLPEVDSAFFSLSRSEIVFAQVLCGPAFFPPRASGTRKGGAKAKTTLPGELALPGFAEAGHEAQAGMCRVVDATGEAHEGRWWKLCHIGGYKQAGLASSHVSRHFNVQPFWTGRRLTTAEFIEGGCGTCPVHAGHRDPFSRGGWGSDSAYEDTWTRSLI